LKNNLVADYSLLLNNLDLSMQVNNKGGSQGHHNNYNYSKYNHYNENNQYVPYYR